MRAPHDFENPESSASSRARSPCSSRPAATAATARARREALRSVRVVEARAATGDASVRAVGVLGPKDELSLGFKIGGVIERIEVDEGDAVRAGELLAVLDRTEIDAAVERAEQAADKAARDLARTRALYAEDVATLEQVEHSKTALNIARADLDAARFNARYARIEAPADGLVLRAPGRTGRARRGGATRSSSSAGSPRVGAVRAAVTDRDVVRLALGDAARVTSTRSRAKRSPHGSSRSHRERSGHRNLRDRARDRARRPALREASSRRSSSTPRGAAPAALDTGGSAARGERRLRDRRSCARAATPSGQRGACGSARLTGAASRCATACAPASAS